MFTFVCLFVGVWKEKSKSAREQKSAPGCCGGLRNIYIQLPSQQNWISERVQGGQAGKSQEVTVAGFRYQIFVSTFRDLKKKKPKPKNPDIFIPVMKLQNRVFSDIY